MAGDEEEGKMNRQRRHSGGKPLSTCVRQERTHTHAHTHTHTQREREKERERAQTFDNERRHSMTH